MKSALPRLAVLAGLWAALCLNFAMGQTIRFRSTEASANAGDSTVAVAGDTDQPLRSRSASPPWRRQATATRLWLRLRLRQELRLRQGLRLRLRQRLR